MIIASHTFNPGNGYGRWARSIVACFELLGHKVWISTESDITSDLKHLVRNQKPDVIVYPPFCPKVAPIMFSTYESDKIHPNMVKLLNQKKLIIVPCEHNRVAYESSGVKNVKVCPMAVENHRFIDIPPFDPFVFLHVGADNSVPERKRSKDVIRAFQIAFPTQEDVRLIVKKDSCDARIPCFDERIEIIHDELSSLDKLYASAHVGVFPCGMEGWGYCQSELMAFGRPIIAPFYGGPADYCSAATSYPLTFTLKNVPKPTYAGYGKCAHVAVNEIVKALKWCYQNKEDVVLKGVLAYRNMARYSLANMARRIGEILS